MILTMLLNDNFQKTAATISWIHIWIDIIIPWLYVEIQNYLTCVNLDILSMTEYKIYTKHKCPSDSGHMWHNWEVHKIWKMDPAHSIHSARKTNIFLMCEFYVNSGNYRSVITEDTDRIVY